jgi:AcrR family transcriptional regulator
MTVDPRPARTRARLTEAALALCAETGRTPSVSAIVTRAATSRSSFYGHFDSAEELLLSILDEALAGISSFDRLARDSGLEQHETMMRASLEAVLLHVEAQPVLYRLVFAPESAGLRIRFGDILARHLRSGFYVPGTVVPEQPAVRDSTALALGQGLATLVGQWVRGEVPFDRPELVRVMQTLFPVWTRTLRIQVPDAPVDPGPGVRPASPLFRGPQTANTQESRVR